MQKLLQFQSPISRSIKTQQFSLSSPFASSPSASLSGDESFSFSNEVLSIINSSHQFEPELEKMSSFLDRETMVSVLQSQSKLKKDPRICYRLFIWSSGKSHLRSGVSFPLMVNMLVRGENGSSFDLYWGVLDELRYENVPILSYAFHVLIQAYWKLKNAKMAVESFGAMKHYDCEPDILTHNMILNVLVKKGVLLMALALYNTMLKSNCKMNCDTFSILIDGLCKNGMIQDALKLFDEMSDKNILPDCFTYTVILSGLCKTGRLDDANRLFNLMKSSGCNPDSATYNVLLDGYSKLGRIDEAFMLLKSFVKDGYKVGMKGFTTLIDGLVRAKRLSEAENLFQKLFEFGLKPDVVLYSIMMRGLGEAGRIKDATNMLRDMIQKGVTPNTFCYNVLIKAFCEAGLIDRAQSLKLEISLHDQFPNSHTYTILICGFCKKGLVKDAQKIFNDMENHGCSPSVVTFNTLIDGLCKSGKLEEAQIMMYKMEIGKNPSLFLRLSQGENRVLDRESLQKMVESLVEKGQFDKAYKLLVQLSGGGVLPNIKTYNTLINGMCKTGLVDGAFKLFEELQLKGLFPDAVTYGTLIEGLHRNNRDEDAFKLFEKMKHNGCNPNSSVYKTLMTWSCRRKKTWMAFGIWLKYMRSLPGREEEKLTLIEEYFETDEYEKAVRNLLEMEIKFADFDSGTYNIWLIGLCQASRVEEALRTFFILQEFGVIVSAPGCVTLIGALCSERKLNEVVQIFHYTMEKGYKLHFRICNNLLQTLLNSEDAGVLAVELIDKMKSAGYNLKSCLNKKTKVLYHHYQIT